MTNGKKGKIAVRAILVDFGHFSPPMCASGGYYDNVGNSISCHICELA